MYLPDISPACGGNFRGGCKLAEEAMCETGVMMNSTLIAGILCETIIIGGDNVYDLQAALENVFKKAA